jgi:hypothetical protein
MCSVCEAMCAYCEAVYGQPTRDCPDCQLNLGTSRSGP